MNRFRSPLPPKLDRGATATMRCSCYSMFIPSCAIDASLCCVIATASGDFAGEGYLYAQGNTPAEVHAIDAADERSRGATSYLNMEPGDCDGYNTTISALLQVLIFFNLPFPNLCLLQSCCLGGGFFLLRGYCNAPSPNLSFSTNPTLTSRFM
ncbi:riboflavin biosynthesis protein RibD [Sesbania bispinosa]|nr:riboflavin biosynthesis protein RibD [Sesbania bispinosa]